MSELKPCPFCGESKLLYSGGCGFRYDDDDNQIRLFRVHCRTCKGRTGVFESLDEAIEAWNRRTNSTTIQPSALGTNLAEVGTRAVRGYPIDADALMEKVAEEYGERARDTLYRIIRDMPPAQPDKDKVSDLLYHIYSIQSPHLDMTGVIAKKQYCEELWKELFGKESELPG